MQKYGFIYLWFDKKHKRFYIGRHWGIETDGYICSSTNMRNNYNNRPHDFKRKIISKIYTSIEDLIIEEQSWLDMIKTEELNEKYYNKTKSSTTPSTKGYNHSLETIEKIRSSNIGKKRSEKTKQLIREANKKQFENANQREIRRQKSLELWSEPEYRKTQIDKKKGKKQSSEQIAKRAKACKDRWKDNPKISHSKSREEVDRIKKTVSNLIWINNGSKNTRINKDLEIPEGFVRGRINTIR
jgi:hypothetical protein